MAANEYLKLTPPRLKSAFAVVTASRSNLWLGKDHLLCVETEGYTEKYKRFYFRDIQAITVRRTNRALVWIVVTGALTVLFALIAFAGGQNATRFTFGIFAGVAAMPLILNLLYGPTCKCELRTAVQTETVPSMSRVRRARKVLDRIRPLIAEAQGLLTPEEIEARFREMVAPPDSEPPVMHHSEPATAQADEQTDALPPP